MHRAICVRVGIAIDNNYYWLAHFLSFSFPFGKPMPGRILWDVCDPALAV
jgi:hypothetical protein